MNDKQNPEIFDRSSFTKSFRKNLFPYFMINYGTIGLIRNLKITSEEAKDEINQLCHQIVKDFNKNKNKDGNITFLGMNHIFQDKLSRLNLDITDSLLLHRYWEYDGQTSFNILLLICSGAYNSAIREMRFVLESFIHAFCIDKHYDDLSLKQKLEKTKELGRNKLWRNKWKLFNENFAEFVDDNIREELYQFYGQLSELVHASYGELVNLRKEIEKSEPESFVSGVMNFFNKDRLLECLTKFNKLHRHLIEILEIF